MHGRVSWALVRSRDEAVAAAAAAAMTALTSATSDQGSQSTHSWRSEDSKARPSVENEIYVTSLTYVDVVS